MKVRIPYVINSDGGWYSGGGKNAVKEPDWSFLMDMADGDEPSSNYQKGWIEVDLPVPPATVDVEGTATVIRENS